MAVSEVLSEQIINQAWTLAVSLSQQLEARLDAAETAVSGGASMGVASVSPITSISKPTVSIPLEALGPDLTLFNEYNDNIITKLVTLFSNYLTDNFPLDAATAAYAETWLQNEINNGGSGINAAIEAQIWERDRSRILDDATRATDEAIATWADRGFPIPPGAAQYQTLQIQVKAQDEIAKSSREAAIDSFKAEIEMIKFAIDEAIKLRGVAVAAAGDYIRAMASSQQTAYHLSMGQSQAQNGLISAAAAFYNAETNAQETMFKSRVPNAQFAHDAAVTNVNNWTTDRTNRGRVAMASADAVAREAAAMFNNLHTSVGVQGTEKL